MRSVRPGERQASPNGALLGDMQPRGAAQRMSRGCVLLFAAQGCLVAAAAGARTHLHNELRMVDVRHLRSATRAAAGGRAGCQRPTPACAWHGRCTQLPRPCPSFAAQCRERSPGPTLGETSPGPPPRRACLSRARHAVALQLTTRGGFSSSATANWRRNCATASTMSSVLRSSAAGSAAYLLAWRTSRQGGGPCRGELRKGVSSGFRKGVGHRSVAASAAGCAGARQGLCAGAHRDVHSQRTRHVRASQVLRPHGPRAAVKPPSSFGIRPCRLARGGGPTRGAARARAHLRLEGRAVEVGDAVLPRGVVQRQREPGLGVAGPQQHQVQVLAAGGRAQGPPPQVKCGTRGGLEDGLQVTEP
jgi:hypothetical protein